MDGGTALTGPLAGKNIGDRLNNDSTSEKDIDDDGLVDDSLAESDIDGDGKDDDLDDDEEDDQDMGAEWGRTQPEAGWALLSQITGLADREAFAAALMVEWARSQPQRR